MSAQLYKPGNTHMVRGIECELQNFDLAEIDYQLNNGWFLSPEEFTEGAEEVNTVPSNEDQDGDDDSVQKSSEPGKNDPGHPVRVEAKEAGIDGWDTKRLATLEKALNESQE